MHEIRMQQESFIPEELKEKRKKMEVDMESIREAQESYIPEELKEKRRKLEVDMEKIRNQVGIKPEELRRKRSQYMIDMQKIRNAQESYIPQELKDKRKKLQVDMAAIRDSVEDHIPEELKARKKELEVDMASIRDAAQDYVPENVRKIRYQYSGDARERAQDVIPEEYKGVKRKRIKDDGPSFLKHGTSKEIVAEDDGLLKSKPYSKADLERQAQLAREAAKDVVPEKIQRIKYEFDEDSIRQADDVIPEEYKKRRTRKGRPQIKTGYTYERIDSQLREKWEKDGSVVVDKSKIKKVKYELKDDARDKAKDVIPEEVHKVKYEFDEDSIRQADDVIPEDVHKVKYELNDSARDSASDFIPEEVTSIKRERKKVTEPTFKEVDEKLKDVEGVSDYKKPEAKSYFDELEKKAKDGETLVSSIDEEGQIARSFKLKEKERVDVAKLSEALRSKAKDPSLLAEKPFEGRDKQKQQAQKADQLEIFMFLTFLGKLVFHPKMIKEKLL